MSSAKPRCVPVREQAIVALLTVATARLLSFSFSAIHVPIEVSFVDSGVAHGIPHFKVNSLREHGEDY